MQKIYWVIKVEKKRNTEKINQSKRNFLLLAANSTAVVGAAVAVWPFIDSMNPAADVLALASIEVDISSVEPGQMLTVTWRGKPVFIRRRTKKEIEEAKNVALTDLKDPQEDKERILKDEWLVVIGLCTHLGCVPTVNKGDYNGWFCPCHGSHYDTSGRIRKGPAPENLLVPEYSFLNENVIKIG